MEKEQKEETFLPNQENEITDSNQLKAFFYCDADGNPIYLTKEIYKKERRFVFYPYSVNIKDGSIKAKRIQKIEFIGWEKIEDIPNDFKVSGKYGIKTLKAKSFFNVLYSKYRGVNFFTIGINVKNSFSADHITLNWADIRPILSDIFKEKALFDKEKIFLINKNLSKINNLIVEKNRVLPAGDLQRFLKKYSSFEKINKDDLNELSAVLDLVPPGIINTTSNFINSKEQINRVYIEDVIGKFEKLMTSKVDNEKNWQDFFAKNAWILSHLFPFEVILRKKEAFIGGKTIDNDEGRIIDFLFENGFKDNYALLEIKTHKKDLLKNVAYRKPSVFSMTDELSGGISQCLDQKDVFLKDYGNKNPSFDPKCILVIGMKEKLTKEQKHCFELLRSGQKNVEIVTFDELLTKLKGLKNVLNYKS